VLIAGGVLLVVHLIGNGTLGNGGAEKGAGKPIAISSATDYDPQGDGEEGPGTISFAVDGNPTGTAWSSEHYDSSTFAGTKTGPDPGVGLYVTTKSDATPAKMLVHTPTPGWDAEVFAAPGGSETPSELSGWGSPVGEVSDATSTQEVDLKVHTPSRNFLLWFRKAAPAHDQAGRYEIEISDIKLFR
jgi:hypothetical protein